MKPLLSQIALLFLVIAAPLGAQTPPNASEATQLYRQAQAEYKKAWEFERSSKIDKAIQSYIEAADLGDKSWRAAESAGLPNERRPSEVYLNPATAHLDAARLLAKQPPNRELMDEQCKRCIIDLGRAASVEMDRAEKNGTALSPDVWKIDNAAGYALFLQGDLANARTQYQKVLARNPGYQPAKDAIAQINKLEEQQYGRFAPQGETPRKTQNFREQIIRVIDDLKLAKQVFDLLKSVR